MRAIDDDGPRFYGDSEPGNCFPDNMTAPPTFLCSLFSGLRELEWENPFEGLLDGNVDWEFFAPVRAGDNITVTSKIICPVFNALYRDFLSIDRGVASNPE